ncbi:DUF1269 domain-containing protein [Aerosakkonemataceae cyanobacterium BLCC-F50]|uniref:DUF1269 domain-containing protein n=1 Tax=Floridaenema flaviceps BLCC-F50 TaxID=3153642 RepID=A0ABV4XKL3_9CYAN
MATLIVVAYEDEFKAEEVRLTLAKLQRQHLIELEDAAVVVKNQEGKVKLKQAVNLTSAGAVSGGFWGLLIGTLFFMPVVGAAIGAASGAIGGALSDIGVDDNFMRELGDTLQPGTSALFVLVDQVTPDKVLDEVAPYGGKILQSSLSKKEEAELQAVLDTHGVQIIQEI